MSLAPARLGTRSSLGADGPDDLPALPLRGVAVPLCAERLHDKQAPLGFGVGFAVLASLPPADRPGSRDQPSPAADPGRSEPVDGSQCTQVPCESAKARGVRPSRASRNGMP